MNFTIVVVREELITSVRTTAISLPDFTKIQFTFPSYRADKILTPNRRTDARQT